MLVDMFLKDGYYVIPVNCKGIAGKGIALQWKLRFPSEAATYAQLCKSKEIRVGQVCLINTSIIFPTKKHWMANSSLAWIKEGLLDLKEKLLVWKLERPVFMPRIGCGCGGLDWNVVKPLISSILGDIVVIVEG